MNKEDKKINKQTMKGVVVSDKMDKTVVVKVETIKTHPKYLKRYKVSKKYKAHDEKNEFKIGDRVLLVEGQPKSKEKKWEVRKVESL